MLSAGSIMATMGLDVSGFTGGMLKAQGMAQLFPSFVTNFLASPLLGIIDLAKRAGAALFGMFTSATENADKINDMSTNVGVAVEVLSGMGLVAKQAGSGLDEMAEAYKMLGRNLAEAAGGNKEAAESFRRLGIAASDSNGIRPLQAVMLELADALAALPPGAERTQAAMSILGRSGTGLVATLSQGSSEIRKQIDMFTQYGAVVTAQSARSADAWGDMIGEVGIAWEGFKNVLAEPIRDTLMPYLNSLLSWVRTHPQEIREVAVSIAAGVAGITEGLARLLAQLATAFVMISTIKGAWEGAKFGAMFGPGGAVMGGIGGGVAGFAGSTYAVHQMREAGNAINNNTYNTTVNSTGTAGGSKQDMDKLADDVNKSWRRSEGQRAVSGSRL